MTDPVEVTLYRFEDDELDATVRVIGEAPPGLSRRPHRPTHIPPARVEVEVFWTDEPKWVTLDEYVREQGMMTPDP